MTSKEQKNRQFKKEALVHLKSIFNMARKLTKNEEKARDLTQETYYRAYRYWSRFQNDTNCKAWLYKILRNTFINNYRARTRRPETVYSSEFAENTVPHDTISLTDNPDPGDHFNRKALYDDVNDAIGELPKKYREITTLAIIDNRSYRDIERITGLCQGTVKSRLARGRRFLRRKLEEHAADRGYETISSESALSYA